MDDPKALVGHLYVSVRDAVEQARGGRVPAIESARRLDEAQHELTRLLSMVDEAAQDLRAVRAQVIEGVPEPVGRKGRAKEIAAMASELVERLAARRAAAATHWVDETYAQAVVLASLAAQVQELLPADLKHRAVERAEENSVRMVVEDLLKG